MLSGLTGHLPEIIIVLVVILIIWGPGKLPDIGAALGKGISEFRKASTETRDAVMGTTTTPAPTPVVQAVVAPAPVEVGVAHDGHQPGLHRSAAQAVQVAIRLQQRFLGDILGRGGVAGQVARQAIGRVDVWCDQFAEPRRTLPQSLWGPSCWRCAT